MQEETSKVKARIIDCLTWCIMRVIQSSLTKDEARVMFKVGWLMMEQVALNPQVGDLQKLGANLLNDELNKNPIVQS